MSKWPTRVGIVELLKSPEVSQYKSQKHHWEISKYWHTLISTYIATLLAPRAMRKIAAMTMVLHDAISTYVSPKDWKREYVPWIVIKKWENDAAQSAEFAGRQGLHPAGCRAIAQHMRKYLPTSWLLDELTSLVMFADILTSLVEIIMAIMMPFSKVISKLRP